METRTPEQVEQRFSPETWEALKVYQQAVDDFLLEHSDVLESGAIFVKFHATDAENIRMRIWARFRGWYHRMSLEERMEKARTMQTRRDVFERKRAEKKARHEARLQEVRDKRRGIGVTVLDRGTRERLERETAEINDRRRRGLPDQVRDVTKEMAPMPSPGWMRVVADFLNFSTWR